MIGSLLRSLLRIRDYRPEEDELLIRINRVADREEEKVQKLTGNFLVDRLIPERRDVHASTK